MLSSPSCPARVSCGCPLFTESLFAPSRCYLSGSCVYHNLNQRYPVLVATIDSCARPDSSSALGSCPKRLSLQVAVSPCWNQPFSNVNPPIFLHVQASLPRLPLWCSYPFLPTELRPSRIWQPVGAGAFAPMAISRTATSVRSVFRGCNDSLMF